MSFADLGLEPGFLKAVQALGYTEPTPIQQQAIPVALTGRDILGCAQTGTGKTAAFILPALQLTRQRGEQTGGTAPSAPAAVPAAATSKAEAVTTVAVDEAAHATTGGQPATGDQPAPGQGQRRRRRRPHGAAARLHHDHHHQPEESRDDPAQHPIRTLVVTPTRELAHQIEEVGRSCARFTGQRVAAVYGGVGYDPQLKKLRRGVDLLVATPGRLLDLSQRRDVDLSKVQILVLDEADRMLDMGFWPDVRRILALLPEKRQNMLFSATLSNDVMRIAGPTLTDPARVEVAPSATPVEAITQAIYPVAEVQKIDLLVRLLEEEKLDRVLVFTRTKHRADRVCKQLERSNIKGEAIHSNRSQSQRQRALDGFKDGTYRVLVATDIVSRGIDVDSISHVINYDLPAQAQDYVHRIGRTARAGHTGTAITFLAAEQANELREIELLLGAPLPTRDLEGFQYMQRLVPNPDRTATKPKPRLVYNGSARRRFR
jgi:ATP-dependent RNA helicase RhlE